MSGWGAEDVVCCCGPETDAKDACGCVPDGFEACSYARGSGNT